MFCLLLLGSKSGSGIFINRDRNKIEKNRYETREWRILPSLLVNSEYDDIYKAIKTIHCIWTVWRIRVGISFIKFLPLREGGRVKPPQKIKLVPLTGHIWYFTLPGEPLLITVVNPNCIGAKYTLIVFFWGGGSWAMFLFYLLKQIFYFEFKL